MGSPIVFLFHLIEGEYLSDNMRVPDRRGINITEPLRKDTDSLKCRVLFRHDIF